MKRSDLFLRGLLAVSLLAVLAVGLRWSRREVPRDRDSKANVQVRNSQRPAASPSFRDVADANGLDFHMNFLPAEQGATFKINLYDHGCGLAVADYNGDGYDDVLLLNQLGANALYRNRGDGRFERVTDDTSPLALADRICVGATFGDYDNDGDQDLYITSTRGGNVMLENTVGSVRDVTEAAGLTLIAHSQTAGFFDYDNDGDLDLYVTNSAAWTSDEFDHKQGYYVGPIFLAEFVRGEDTSREFNILYRNDGEGRFSDVTAESGLKGHGWSGDIAVFDYDGNDDLDLFVANMFGYGHLYENDGHGCFHDVTQQTLRRTSFGAIGCKAFDYDNDGRLDLFVADMHSDMFEVPAEASLVLEQKKLSDVRGRWKEILLGEFGADYKSRFLFGNTLYHNGGSGVFAERSDAAGVETFWPWGIAVGDFDNDGYEDAFVPSGMGYPFFYWHSYLLLNNGDGTFSNSAAQQGIEPPAGGEYLAEPIGGKRAARSSRCAATGDFDGDGRLDLIVNNFNDRPYYFKNAFPPRHYIAFRLRGTKSNRDAIGATVTLHIDGQRLTRQVDAAGGYLSQSSKTLHFGLGDTTRIDTIEVRWPGGKPQRFGPFDVDRLYELMEED